MAQPQAEHGRPLDAALGRLTALDALLRAEGMAHSPDRWLNLQDLLVRMAAEGRLPREPADLRRHLAPLFCRSPEEQARFGEIFGRWLAGLPGRALEPPPESPPPAAADREIPHTPYWPFGLAAVLLIALVTGLVYWYLRPPPTPEALPPPEEAVAHPEPGPDPSGDDAWKTLPLQPLPPRTPVQEPVLDAQHRAWLAAGDDIAPWVVAMLAAAGLAWRWLRRRVVLRRRRGDPRDPLASIPVAGVDEALFGGSEVRAALRRLHTPVGRPTRRLAPRPTVERTVRLAGLFTPVYLERPEVPDLVLLVDFRHRADHMAGLGDLVEERLREAGLMVHRYDYQGEPRLARGSEEEAWLGLEELVARHPGSRLLVAGDPAALLDAWSGALLPWAEGFAAWPERGLLHTRAPAHAWRDVLEGSGFALAPLSSAGLVSLGTRLTKAPPAPDPGLGVRLPALLAEGEPWLADGAPREADRSALIAVLRDHLGGPGMLLLAAMAGYPALHWGLTRALDLSLFPGGGDAFGREQRLLRLAALPWCRAGWMPEWLRETLLRGLTPVQLGRVTDLYRALFREHSLQGAEGIRLPVALPPPLRTRWQRLRERLHPRGRRLGRYLRDLLSLVPPHSLVEDRIFANLLLGKGRGLLDFELPRRFARHLPRLRWAAALRPRCTAPQIAQVGGWVLQAAREGWGRSVAAEALLAAERIAHGAYQVEIIHTPETSALAQALRETLRRHGFEAVEPVPWPMAVVEGGEVPEGGSADNSVQYALGEEVAADYVAGRLQYLTHGLGVELSSGVFEDTPPPFNAAPQVGQLRVWLREPGRTGTSFRDPLAMPLAPEAQPQPPLPSATDLWNKPATVVYLVDGGGDPVLPLEDMFNGVAGVSVGGGSILANGKPPGTVHAVEWTMGEAVTVKSLNLFLAHDGRVASDSRYKLRDARARGITRFELFADAGSGFERVFSADVQMIDGGDTGPQPRGQPVCPSPDCFDLYDPVYGGASLSGRGTSFATLDTVAGYLTISADFQATTADTWRAQFTQFGNFLDLYSDTGGSRILELDGLAESQFTSATGKDSEQPPDKEQAPAGGKRESSTTALEPDMIELPGGSFRMGCVSGKGCISSDELPVHEVSIRPFAIGRHEVTFEEYDRFAAVTGRKPPDDKGWGRGRRPVINVSWDDATAYAQWLAKETGKPYRLPTEAEWEYATRAGTETPFSTGECIDTDQANYNGEYSWERCPETGVYRAQTVEAGSLPPNPWGLHEVHGNVWEWIQDCWHASYEGAPQDGSAWEKGGECGGRVVRGGAWFNSPEIVRSAFRDWNSSDAALLNLGFRLARTL